MRTLVFAFGCADNGNMTPENPIWRINLDFEVLPDENFIAMFEIIEQTIGRMIDNHGPEDECVRFWAMQANEVTEIYDEEMVFDGFGTLGFIPDDSCLN